MRKDAMTIKISDLDLSMKQELPKLRDFYGFFSNLARGKFKNYKTRKDKVPEPRTNLLFNSIGTAEETTLSHGVWGNDGVVLNSMRHSLRR